MLIVRGELANKIYCLLRRDALEIYQRFGEACILLPWRWKQQVPAKSNAYSRCNIVSILTASLHNEPLRVMSLRPHHINPKKILSSLSSFSSSQSPSFLSDRSSNGGTRLIKSLEMIFKFRWYPCIPLTVFVACSVSLTSWDYRPQQQINSCAGPEVLTAVSIKITINLDVTPFGSLKSHRSFAAIYRSVFRFKG